MLATRIVTKPTRAPTNGNVHCALVRLGGLSVLRNLEIGIMVKKIKDTTTSSQILQSFLFLGHAKILQSSEILLIL